MSCGVYQAMVFSKGGVFAQLAEWCSVKSAFTATAVENLGGLACTICRKMQLEATLWLNVAQKVWNLGNRYYAQLEFFPKGVLSGLRHPGFLSYQRLERQRTCH